jgi:hypothetical protein
MAKYEASLGDMVNVSSPSPTKNPAKQKNKTKNPTI